MTPAMWPDTAKGFRFSLVNPCGDWRCVHGWFAVYCQSQDDADRRAA